MVSPNGIVYLVGTGPGEVSLITAKGLALVREADVLVGDLLGHARLLQEARPEAERRDVGCRTSRSQVSQAQVNQWLVDLARQGKSVVRLWPGDPFIFGRAAQELAHLRQAGLRVEVVPGVSSALAAPAYAGVPLTHWEYNTGFAVVTGYESKNPAVKTDWRALAQIDPLVILMPLDDLPQITARLMAEGKAAETPAVVVQQASLPQQKQVLATLATLAEVVEKAQIRHPAVAVVGQVAALSSDLAWFEAAERQPLRGQRVLVTRPAHQAADFMVALRDLGAQPISFPTIEIKPVEDSTALDTAIHALGSNNSVYDWLVLTSANGVAAFWERLQVAGFDSRVLSRLNIAAIGPATAAALQQRSITPDLVPEVYTAEGVLEAFDQMGSVAGHRFLLTRADIARKTLAEGLIKRGAVVEEIAVYRTIPRPDGPPPPVAEIVTFTSSSTVQGYVNCLAGRSPKEVLRESQVVCIGPITAATAKELGVPVSAIAAEFTIDGMLELLKALGREASTGKEI